MWRFGGPSLWGRTGILESWQHSISLEPVTKAAQWSPCAHTGPLQGLFPVDRGQFHLHCFLVCATVKVTAKPATRVSKALHLRRPFGRRHHVDPCPPPPISSASGHDWSCVTYFYHMTDALGCLSRDRQYAEHFLGINLFSAFVTKASVS